MGRPRKTAAESAVSVPLAAPRDLTPAQRAVWTREIAAMPAGFFTQADVPALMAYCDTRCEYQRIHRALSRAKGDERNRYAVEYRAIAKLLLAQHRGLRLLPSARTHKDRAANLAAQPTVPEVPGKAAWEVMMDRAAENMRRDRTN